MTETQAIDPQAALALIQELGEKRIPVYVDREDCFDRVLAETVLSKQNQPSFARVCMDGVAVQYGQGVGEWLYQSTQMAGEAAHHLMSPDYAIEVATGAVCPAGADLVIPYEHLERTSRGWRLKESMSLSLGQNVQAEGFELKSGQILLAKGSTLLAPELSLLAAQGFTHVPVYQKPTVALLSNGSELVLPELSPAAYQIRDANRSGLKGLLRSYGYSVSYEALVQDDRRVLTEKLLEALEQCRVLVISAGVSRGPLDLVPEVLTHIGVKAHIRALAQKPGKPLFFGTLGSDRFVFGLPGNPVAALMNAAYYTIPLLRQLEARPFRQRWRIVHQDIDPQAKAMFYAVKEQCDGSLQTISLKGSADLAGLRGTAGFIMVPAYQRVRSGDRVVFVPWSFESAL